MNKIWKFKESKSNKVILIKDKIIYKGNPKGIDLNSINLETTESAILKDLFSIPFSYIKKIENQVGKNHIKILFGNDIEEELEIDDEKIKTEIFEFIKSENPKLLYSSKIPTVINYTKAQISALLILTGFFIFSLYLALQIENGVEYELVGNGKPGIVAIVFVIANLGSVKIIFGYIILLCITILSLRNKLKSRSETEILIR